jgi:tRNA threonylcarbamoyladenosine biosynthesis protein TsaE
VGERAAYDIVSEAAMEAFGGALARAADAALTLYLSGQLAAGKTTLARGFLRARGYAGAVKSPTFTLVESYEIAPRTVHHFDLYRIADPEELEYIGLDEYFDAGADCLVEWPQRAAGVLPLADVEIELEVYGGGRRLRLTANTERGRGIAKGVAANGAMPR